MGVTHGNREKQDKYLVWIAEKEKELQIRTQKDYVDRTQGAAVRVFLCERWSMVERIGNQVTRVDAHLLGGQSMWEIAAGRTAVARIIGALILTLLVGSSAFGQFVIQPMKLVVPVAPGKRTPVALMLENTTNNTTQIVDLRLVDVAQDANGVWQAIEPDAVAVDGPNGARLVSVGTDLSPNFVDISRLRSCQSWLRLMQNQIEVRPLNRETIQLVIDVPSGTRGYYCAALLAQALIGPQVVEGYMSNVVLEFLVPIIVEVQGRPERQNVELTDVGLEFRPQDERGPAATRVTLSINNSGGTYSLLKGYARIWGKLGGHWRKLADREFPSDISIIPGAEFRLRTDVGCALGAGDYRVEGYLFVDGAKGASTSKELTFQGDPRVRGGGKGTAALDMDQREVIVDTMPGQTRSASLLVVNASDEAVNVDLEVGLPEHMADRVAGNIRGDQFECASWLTVSPTKFTLEGHSRVNLRILSEMPSDAANPNYYAMIRMHAVYADGQEGGKTDCRVCVQNRKAQGSILIQGLPVRLAELTPGRYAVTAQFGNYGDTHLQPTCRAVLTAVSNNEVIRKFNLSNDILSQSGLMLPLEMRSFTGVMDVSGVPTGNYRLTAVLIHDKGGDTVLKQIGLEVTATANGRAVRSVELAGPPLPVKL